MKIPTSFDTCTSIFLRYQSSCREKTLNCPLLMSNQKAIKTDFHLERYTVLYMYLCMAQANEYINHKFTFIHSIHTYTHTNKCRRKYLYWKTYENKQCQAMIDFHICIKNIKCHFVCQFVSMFDCPLVNFFDLRVFYYIYNAYIL